LERYISNGVLARDVVFLMSDLSQLRIDPETDAVRMYVNTTVVVL
jgi:hypothetical protein